MAYIVFIPTTSQGETTYIQRTFTDMKGIAKWAMNAVLDPETTTETATNQKPVANVEGATVPAPVSMSVSASKPVPCHPSYPFVSDKTIKEYGKEYAFLFETDAKPPTEEIPEPVWSVDTEAWFMDISESPFVSSIIHKDWKALSKKFIDTVKRNGFKPYGDIADWVVTTEDYRQILTVVLKTAELIQDELPGLKDSGVHWEQLPPVFFKTCEDLIKTQEARETLFTLCFTNNTSSFLTTNCELIQHIFTMIRFFSLCSKSQWLSNLIGTKTYTYVPSDPDIVVKLINEWKSGKKASDDIREFILKMIVIQSFTKSDAKSVGSNDFRETYMEIVKKFKWLPEPFLEWATKSTSFANCKKALEEIGILQIRKTEGQRFMNIEIVTNVSNDWEYPNALDWRSHKTNILAPINSDDGTELTNLPEFAQLTGEGNGSGDLMPIDWQPFEPLEIEKLTFPTGFTTGLTPVSQILRNPNVQLRADPPCPHVQISPWHNSTIVSDRFM